jgi:hypothetical protein
VVVTLSEDGGLEDTPWREEGLDEEMVPVNCLVTMDEVLINGPTSNGDVERSTTTS